MDKLPLGGRKIVLTRARGQNEEFGAALRALGAETIECPAIRIAPPEDWRELDAGLAAVCDPKSGARTIVFTSANAARMVLERLAARGIEPGDLNAARIVAIGAATARALRRAQVCVDLVPAIGTAEGLVAELAITGGEMIFLPQADIARPTLRDGLLARGAAVRPAVAYRTVPEPQVAELAAILQQPIDAITFTSSSTVSYTLDGLAEAGVNGAALLKGATIASIGPQTSATARERGLRVDLEAIEHTTEGLARALAEHFG